MTDLIKINSQEIMELFLSIQDDYSYEIKHFANYIQCQNLPVNKTSIEKYLKSMDNDGTPVRTFNKRLQAVKKRVRSLLNEYRMRISPEDFYLWNEFLNNQKGKVVQAAGIGEEKLITKEEYNILLDSPAVPDYIKFFARFLFVTGVRISEAVNIRLKNIKINGQWVYIRILGKRNKERIVRIRPQLYKDIINFFSSRTFLFEDEDGERYKRSRISVRLLRHGRELLDKNISSHSFRHGWGTRAAQLGNLEGSSEYLGHSDPATFLKFYCHEPLSDDHLDKLADNGV